MADAACVGVADTATCVGVVDHLKTGIAPTAKTGRSPTALELKIAPMAVNIWSFLETIR